MHAPTDPGDPHDPLPALYQEYNPFDTVEFLPGLAKAVLWVVLAFALAQALLLGFKP